MKATLALIATTVLIPTLVFAEGTDMYFGARFKEGKGVEVSPETTKILNLKTSPAEEIRIGATNAILIPKESVLKTVSGQFVYVVNGKHYLRTAIQGTPYGTNTFKIEDGLFAGDEVVTNGVNPLWYAELQSIRGGKACADGH